MGENAHRAILPVAYKWAGANTSQRLRERLIQKHIAVPRPVQAKSKQAMKQVLGIRDEKARMTVTPPLAMAPVTQEDDMRWNPNDDGIVFNP